MFPLTLALPVMGMEYRGVPAPREDSREVLQGGLQGCPWFSFFYLLPSTQVEHAWKNDCLRRREDIG